MGRHHHLPEHLYISRNLSPPNPPQPPPYSLSSASSFLSVQSAVYYSSSAALLQETGRTTALAVSDRIPGLKTSAAFFNTLRANLILDADSTPPSLTNTPDSLRPISMASSSSLPPPLPSPLAHAPDFSRDSALVDSNQGHLSLDSIPELTTKPAVSEDDKVEALHLLADSVAQQRQLAASAVIFHPVTLSVAALLLGLVYQHLYKGSGSDYAIIGTTSVGILMAMLVTIRWMTSGYIEEAGNVGTWKWLDQGRHERDSGAVGDEDEILLTRFGDEVIGTLILRGQRATPPSSSGNSSPKKSRKNYPVVGVIRGWTVKRRYRHKGVGQGLLEEAVQLCQSNGWNGPEFADDHANSRRILPPTFHGGFAKRERLGREMLERVKGEVGKPVSSGGRKGKR